MAEYSRLSHLPAPLLRWYHPEPAHPRPGGRTPSPIGCGCRRSCSSRPGWRPCCPTYERFLAALPDVAGTGCRPGGAAPQALGGAGVLQPGAQPAEGRPGGGGAVRRRAARRLRGGCRRCPASASTPPGPSSPSPLACPTPAVDGNVLRVVCRITGDETPVDSPALKRRMPGGTARPSIRRGRPGTSPRR